MYWPRASLVVQRVRSLSRSSLVVRQARASLVHSLSSYKREGAGIFSDIPSRRRLIEARLRRLFLLCSTTAASSSTTAALFCFNAPNA